MTPEIKAMIDKVREDLNDLEKALTATPVSTVTPEQEFAQLKTLLASSDWPEAVPPYLICDPDNPQQLEERADGILDDVVDIKLEGIRLLDYACCSDHVAKAAIKRKAALAVAYNSKATPAGEPPCLLTNSLQKVKDTGPYDLVLVYDVLDHLVQNEQVQKLKDIGTVLAPNGKIWLRTHPWCSRTGGHLYRQTNKAFVHLVFTQEELKSMGMTAEPGIKIIHPILNYSEWCKAAGFKIDSTKTLTERVEPFFSSQPLVSARIKKNWITSQERDLATGQRFPEFQLSQHFFDLVLVKA